MEERKDRGSCINSSKVNDGLPVGAIDALGDSSNENDCLGEEVGGTSKWGDDDIQYLQNNLATAFEPIGLDTHPFLVSWYNEKVGPKFQLNYPKDTLAFVIINGPHVFEKCIVPYTKARIMEDPDFHSNNLMDDSIKHAFTIVTSDLISEGFQTDMFYDFDLHPSRRPKVLVQTAAHVAGAVQYFHKNNLPTTIQMSTFGKKSDLNGVAIHPKYGGWFAIRGVIIFSNVQLSEETKSVQRPEPVEIFNDPAQVARVIELFAYEWQTNEWRNFHPGLGLKYTDDFITYLNMEPTKRWEYVKRYCAKTEDEDDPSDTLVPTS